MRIASLAGLLLASLAPVTSADVLVVDASGGGEFTSLATAVAAADDGDTILLRPGDYRNPFGNSIQITSAVVIAADGTGAVLTDPLIVQAGGKQVVLRGLSIDPGLFNSGPSLWHIGGDLFVDGCTVIGRAGSASFGSTFGGVGLRVSGGGGELVLKDCVVRGGRGSNSHSASFLLAQPGGIGLHVLAAVTLSIHGGSVTGGAGGDDTNVDLPGNGAAGGIGLLSNVGATLLLAGCTVTGGAGGDGLLDPGDFGSSTYAGGHGVSLGNSTQLRLLDATLAGGQPGVDGGGSVGSPGIALATGANTVVLQFPGAYRGLGFGAPTPEGGLLSFELQGVAGDFAGLFVSLAPGLLPGPQGFFHLGAPLLGPILLGPVGPSGTLDLSFGVPSLGFGPDEAVTFFAQALMQPASGPLLLSAPATAVLHDDSL